MFSWKSTWYSTRYGEETRLTKLFSEITKISKIIKCDWTGIFLKYIFKYEDRWGFFIDGRSDKNLCIRESRFSRCAALLVTKAWSSSIQNNIVWPSTMLPCQCNGKMGINSKLLLCTVSFYCTSWIHRQLYHVHRSSFILKENCFLMTKEIVTTKGSISAGSMLRTLMRSWAMSWCHPIFVPFVALGLDILKTIWCC